MALEVVKGFFGLPLPHTSQGLRLSLWMAGLKPLE